jgi:hypothetical protein
MNSQKFLLAKLRQEFKRRNGTRTQIANIGAIRMYLAYTPILRKCQSHSISLGSARLGNVLENNLPRSCPWMVAAIAQVADT